MNVKYPFRVEATYRNGEKRWHETHNFEVLQGAEQYASQQLRKSHCVVLRILVVLEELKADHGGSN